MGTLFPAQHLIAPTKGRPAQPSWCLSLSSSTQSPFLRQTHHRPTGVRSRFLAANATASAISLYDILELPPHVGLSDIKRAYRQMARRYHPDVCPSGRAEESTRRFIEIQEAYETLSDPRRRAVYDHAVAIGRGSAAAGRIPWSPSDQDCEPSDWKSQWETQLSAFKRQSFMGARRADSWAARMRMQNGIH
ncbi:hypothetical protein GOP47_0008746 [Adiantum capillus-veneris]|uniref:J domain-containing protein n=1 Tax=Adiantum capillus-veneris TaxID=13818 RepID=A0A9D4UYY2_ADICA|nr:hypothetical protein GOP47_0008746 [Adiantum capillus-veneris]